MSKVITIQVGSIRKSAPALTFWFVNKAISHPSLSNFIITWLFCQLIVIKKLCYDEIALAGIGVEVNHQTLISNPWRYQMGTKYLLRGGVAISSVFVFIISRGVLQSMEKTSEMLISWEMVHPWIKQTTVRAAYHLLCLSKLDELELYMWPELRTCRPASNTWLQTPSVWNRRNLLPNLFRIELRTDQIPNLATNAQLVEKAIRIADEIGFSTMTPAETREKLKLVKHK